MRENISIALAISWFLAGFTLGTNTPLLNPVPNQVARLVVDPEGSQFGQLIEGAATDSWGNFYTANYGDDQTTNTLAMVTPNGTAHLIYRDSNSNTWLNSVRSIRPPPGHKRDHLRLLTGDVKGHRVLQLDYATRTTENLVPRSPVVSVRCADPGMLQPNDLAVTSDDHVYLSGMNYTQDSILGDGDLWWCNPQGEARRLDIMYRTNGIEVSPGNRYLYLSEAINRNGSVVANRIWRYHIDPSTGVKLRNQRPIRSLFVDFEKLDQTQAADVDGMRCDSQGNLFVTRNSLGQVVVFNPKGVLKFRIHVPTIQGVTNLEFSGPDGRVLHIVGSCRDKMNTTKGCIARWTHDTTGLEWELLH
ncbi:hypothetical protein IWQ61_000514 [Dispira simplex]|nr:hypothetical protein IWQ61_000514 [Dispira simplex]